MRSNPLASEMLTGLARPGKAQLHYLGMLLVQVVVVLFWWPRDELAQLLEAQNGPSTLAGAMMAIGITTAYHAIRAGAEELVLPGQHGLRDWALATSLGAGRILRGYLLGHLVYDLYLLALSSPLVLMAFTVSGGEWPALAWCTVATLVQALFYTLCGAITLLALAKHRGAAHAAVRTIVIVMYVVVGLAAPFLSHVMLTSRLLGEESDTQPAFAGVSDPVAFLAAYGPSSVLAAAILYWLLLRARRGAAGRHAEAGAGEAAVP